MNVKDLSIPTARLYAMNLMKSLHVEQIVESLEFSRVSKEVLEQSELQCALGQNAYDDEFGKRIRELLFRFLHISKGQRDVVNEAVEICLKNKYAVLEQGLSALAFDIVIAKRVRILLFRLFRMSLEDTNEDE